MREAMVVTAVRTAVGKAPRGKLSTTRPDDLAALAVAEAIRRVEGLGPEDIEDVIIGCANPEAEQGSNLGRVVATRAGLPHAVPAFTVNRFCASGLQTIALASQQILSGMGECIVAGGTESMSLVPMAGHRPTPNPWLVEHHPSLYLGMGLTAENVAREYGVSREAQDEFAYRSHMRAIAAQDGGKFKDEIVALEVEKVWVNDDDHIEKETVVFATDEGPRRDTSLGALAKLPPVFHRQGTVTAGNSSQMSDGAAAVVIMEGTRAESLQLSPLARFVSFAACGVRPEVMGIGPIAAVPKALRLAGLRLEDIGLIELNEAFAAQALAVIRELGMDLERVNVNGGAIALGHPLGCTGTKLTVQLLHEMKRRGTRYGMVTMCIGGGMGAAAIFENGRSR